MDNGEVVVPDVLGMGIYFKSLILINKISLANISGTLPRNPHKRGLTCPTPSQ